MSNSRKPYLKLTDGKHFVVFNSHNNVFVESFYAFCSENNIPYAIRPISSGRLHVRIEGSLNVIKKVNFYLKNEYDEFHSYNKELYRLIKHKLI